MEIPSVFLLLWFPNSPIVMTFDNPILFFLCSIGVFNGFLASFYFLFFSKEKRVQNLFFGFLLLMLSLRIGKSVYVIFTERSERNLLILQIGLSACFLIGVALFYYIKSSVNNIKVIPRLWKIHILTLIIIIFSIGIIAPYKTNISLWSKYVVHTIYAVWGLYILMSGFCLKDVFKRLTTKKVVLTTSELWLVWVFIGNLLIFSAYIIGYFYLYLIGTITFSVVFYALLVFLLSKSNRENVFKDIPEKYASKKIKETEANILVKNLNKVMLEKQFYKNTNIKLNDIAKEIQISSHQLSQLLNDNLGKSFALFINEYRIDEAKRILKENNQFTLEAIGFEAGFSSKSNFYATFKKIVGKTPSEFKKQYS
ncbi:helix-turn-helix domain-containing protein [Polaribacter sp. Z022]|uniref:helix-turn-helix domain-containing protein n=1 Tax=Polaribacter sp. Z022 TaxID=2927125 RepID=UPI002020CCF3|nr:helix-turn-helix domain-containing protein [Polaribacter sp. Z022]MCL7752978.1 helix-turn-helix domain-containing protein [Polaribacter sp. Z022]